MSPERRTGHPRSSLLFSLLLAASAAADEGHVEERADEHVERTPLQTVVPVYPEKARRERIEGEVQVCYHIDKQGRPYRIAVRNSTHRIFERPSIVAVRASSYAPLAPGEKNPGIKSCRTFRFALEPVQDA